MKDYYQVLGVSENANQEEIKNAYRRLALKYHPDRSTGSESQFQDINEAYRVLSNVKSRFTYDQQRHKKQVLEKITQQHREPVYSESTLKKGKWFVVVFFTIVLLISLLALTFSARYNLIQGIQYEEQGQLNKALSSYDYSASIWGPYQFDAINRACWLTFKNSRPEIGLYFVEEGLKFPQTKNVRSKLFYLSGYGHELQSNYEKAIEEFEKSLELGYRQDSVHIHLGNIYTFQKNDPESGIFHYLKVLENTYLEEAQFGLAFSYYLNGELKDALSTIDQFIQDSGPQAYKGYYLKSLILIKSGNISEGCQAFEMAKRLGYEEIEDEILSICTDLPTRSREE